MDVDRVMPLFLYYKKFAVFILVYVQFTNAYYNAEVVIHQAWGEIQ